MQTARIANLPGDQAETCTVTVRYFAAARAASGLAEESVDLIGPATVADLVSGLGGLHGSRLGYVLRSCSFLVNEIAARDRGTPVPRGATVDVLPPFAGG
ncbi:MoaD/ThiS family protein [Amycolatopsis sp.]|uniref:MoaD/ThiS family protein n=1 Tax=Amycolatopsis sp. TaxID=37632 RepID=UPI002E0B4B62|nr:MoaD/ThiS family protein [Amycolatopsis sp.]